MHFFLPAGTFKLGSHEGFYNVLFISLAACLSCMFSELWAALIAADFFPENCAELRQQQNTQYFSTVPCDGEGERGEAMAEMHLQGLFYHLYGTNVNSSHFLPAGNLASDYTACPSAFAKWVMFLIFWFKLKFPSPAVFIASRMQNIVYLE